MSAADWTRARRAAADVDRRRIRLVPRRSIAFPRNSEYPLVFRPTWPIACSPHRPLISLLIRSKCLVSLSRRSKSHSVVFLPSLKRLRRSAVYPAAALVSTFWLTLFQTINVGRSRKRANIPYPQRTLPPQLCVRLICVSCNHWQCMRKRPKQQSPKKLPSSTVHNVSALLNHPRLSFDSQHRCTPEHTGILAHYHHGVRSVCTGTSLNLTLFLER